MKNNFEEAILAAHISWQDDLRAAVKTLNGEFLEHLNNNEWLPKNNKIFNAFSLPKNKVKYILLGETPYPREESANGYAFWDNNCYNIWNKEGGLEKQINKATSLRNIIKMLLVEAKLLGNQRKAEDIRKIDHSQLIQTIPDFFEKMMDSGVLLLNASPTLSTTGISKKNETKEWQPFINCILGKIPNSELILFGRLAEEITTLENAKDMKKHISEHPYNISFIDNTVMQQLFSKINPLGIY